MGLWHNIFTVKLFCTIISYVFEQSIMYFIFNYTLHFTDVVLSLMLCNAFFRISKILHRLCVGHRNVWKRLKNVNKYAVIICRHQTCWETIRRPCSSEPDVIRIIDCHTRVTRYLSGIFIFFIFFLIIDNATAILLSRHDHSLTLWSLPSTLPGRNVNVFPVRKLDDFKKSWKKANETLRYVIYSHNHCRCNMCGSKSKRSWSSKD